MLRVVAVVAGLASAFPAMAGEMTASEARQFVVDKLFSYTCFDGTRGMARVACRRFSGWLHPSSRRRPNPLWPYAAWHLARWRRPGLRVHARRHDATVLLS